MKRSCNYCKYADLTTKEVIKPGVEKVVCKKDRGYYYSLCDWDCEDFEFSFPSIMKEAMRIK